MSTIKEFIESFRQTGNTTALVRLALQTSSFLVVGNQNMKQVIIKNHTPAYEKPLLEKLIITLQDIKNDKHRGREVHYLDQGAPMNRTVFFDNTAIVYNEKNNESEATDGYGLSWNQTYTDGKWSPITITNNHHTLTIPNSYFNINNEDGYISKNNKQINIKMTEEDAKDIAEINQQFFESEATNSMLGRILLRKGIQFYKKLKENF